MVPKAVPILSLRRYGFRAKADHGARCSEWPWRAQSVNSMFSLRALVARKMLRMRNFHYCWATAKPAIRATPGVFPPVWLSDGSWQSGEPFSLIRLPQGSLKYTARANPWLPTWCSRFKVLDTVILQVTANVYFCCTKPCKRDGIYGFTSLSCWSGISKTSVVGVPYANHSRLTQITEWSIPKGTKDGLIKFSHPRWLLAFKLVVNTRYPRSRPSEPAHHRPAASTNKAGR